MPGWPFDTSRPPWAPRVPTPESTWSFASWWLIRKDADPQLAYSWCVSRHESRRPALQHASVGISDEHTLLRLVVSTTWEKTVGILAELLRGESLVEALERANVSAPAWPVAGDVGLRLAQHVENIGTRYVAAPWVVREPLQLVSGRMELLGDASSPSNDSLALTRSILLRDPVSLFGASAAPADIEGLAQRLEKETGLSFRGPGLVRLGSIEAMWFPTLSDDDRPLVSVRATREKIIVEIADGVPENDFVARCRQRLRGSILADSLLKLEPTEGTYRAEFETPEGGPYSAHVEVWTSGVGAESTLFFAQEFHWLRQLGIRLTTPGPPTNRGTDWLNSFSEEASARVHALDMKPRRTDVGVLNAHPGMLEQALELRSRIAPQVQPSSAAFFSARDRRDFVLELAGWVAGSARKAGADRVLLLDPNLDELGLEVVRHLEVSGVEVTVVTCLEHRLAADQVRRRLKHAASQASAAHARLRTKVFEFVSRPEAAEPPFSLQAVLFFQSDTPKSGWSLSASLDGDVPRAPVIAAPIDGRALRETSDYVRSLIRGAHELDRDLVVLWPEGSPRPEDQSQEPIGAEEPLEPETAIASLHKSISEGNFPQQWTRIAHEMAHSRSDATLKLIVAEPKILMAVEDFVVQVAADKPAPVGLADAKRRAPSEKVLRTMELKRGFVRAMREVRGWQRYMRADWWQPWSMRFAAIALGQTPDKIVAAIEGVIARERTSDAAIGEICGHLLREVNDSLSHSTRAAAVAEALISSRLVALRALGSTALRTQADGLERLNGLENQYERVATLAEWTYNLRVEANQAITRAKTAREPTELSQRRRPLFDALRRYWVPLTQEQLQEVVSLLSGPITGSWALSTHSELLLPLCESGKLERHRVEDLWFTILESRVLGNSQFYLPVDEELTQLVAFQIAESERQGEALREAMLPFTEALGGAATTLDRPFLRSTSYQGWADARDTVLWISTLGRLVLLAERPSDAASALAREWLQTAADVARGPESNADPTRLGEFAAATSSLFDERGLGDR